MFGRTAEIEAVRSALNRARAGKAATVLLAGEGGIGKTRLLSEVEQLASDEKFSIIAGGAFELGRNQAFSLIAEVIPLTRRSPDPRAAAIATLLADVERETPGVVGFGSWASLEFRIVEEIVDLVEDRTSAGPAALLLDDLHWSDPASLRVVGALARRLAGAPLLIVGTYRRTPPNPELEATVRDLEATGAHVLDVSSLDQEAVSALVESRLHENATEGIAANVARAGGNPLLIIELLERLRSDPQVPAEGAGSSDRDFLRAILGRRLRGLSQPTMEMLRIASIFGSVASTSDLAMVTGKAITELMPSVEEALRDGVLLERDDRLGFRHDLIRDALYADIPADVRRALHLAAGRALATLGGSPVAAASHMATGASVGDRDAFEMVFRAGRETLRASPTVAVELLSRARDLLTPGDPLARDVEATLAIALSWAGHPHDAAETARTVLAGRAAPEVEGLAQTALWNSLIMQGRLLEANQMMAGLGEGGLAGRRERATYAAFDALTRLFTGDFEGSERTAAAALDLAHSDPTPWGESVALICLAWTESTKGRFGKALELSVEAVRSPGRHPFADLLHGLILADTGRFEEAERVYRAAIRSAQDSGAAWLVPLHHYGLMGLRYYEGQFDDSIAEAETGLALAEEFGVALGILMPLATLSHIATKRGNLDEARRLVERGEEQIARTGPNIGFDRLVGMRTNVAAIEHDFDIADVPLAQATWQVIKVAGAAIGAIIATAPELIRGIRLSIDRSEPDHPLRAGSIEVMEEIAADVERIAAGSGIKGLEGSALRCRALHANDVDAALGAVALFRDTPYHFHRALACEDAALLLGRAGRLQEARPLLDEALEIYERAGATWDTARATSILRSLGLRRGARKPRKRAASGWESLTPTEEKVAGLVADGLTNRRVGERLFLSRHTVDTHLRHIYGKLGLSSRVELAAARASAWTRG